MPDDTLLLPNRLAEVMTVSLDASDDGLRPSEAEKRATFDAGWNKVEGTLAKKIANGNRVIAISSAVLALVVVMLMAGTLYSRNILGQLNAIFALGDRPKMVSTFVADQVDIANKEKEMKNTIQIARQWISVSDRAALEIRNLKLEVSAGKSLSAEFFNQNSNRSVSVDKNGSSFPILSFSYKNSESGYVPIVHLVSVNYTAARYSNSSSIIFSSSVRAASAPVDVAVIFSKLPLAEQLDMLSRIEGKIGEARKETGDLIVSLERDLKLSGEEMLKKSEQFSDKIAPDPFEMAGKVVFMLTLYTISASLLKIIMSEVASRNHLIEMQVRCSLAFGLAGVSELPKGGVEPVSSQELPASSHLDKVLDVLKGLAKK